MFRSLQGLEYRRFWLVTAGSSAARWTYTLAIGWALYTLTHSAYWVGTGIFMTLVPNLLGAPLGGVLADRVDRRQVLIWSSVIGVAATTFLVVAAWLQIWSVPLLLAVTLIFGFAGSVRMVSLNALLPSLVPSERLFNAISLQSIAQRGTEFVGPALASPLLALYGASPVFAFCSLLGSIAIVFAIVISTPKMVQSSASRGGLYAPVRDGFNYMRKQPSIRMVMSLIAFH